MMSTVTTKLILDKRIQKKDGTYSVKVRVTHGRVQKYAPIRDERYKYLTIEDWDKANSENTRGINKERKDYFDKIRIKASTIASELKPYSFSKFKLRFYENIATSEVVDIFGMFRRHISKLHEQERIGTATSYQTALNSLQAFTKKKSLEFDEVNVEWLEKYERFMMSKDKSSTTIGIYLRSLRTVVNMGLKAGLMSKEVYPFGKNEGGYEIPGGRNPKKALDLKTIKRILDFDLPKSIDRKWRAFWFFSYLCNGANMKDIANLKYKDVTETRITFIRAKTARTTKRDAMPIMVMMLPEIKAIIDEWGMKPKTNETYVFGIIDREDDIYTKRAKIQQASKSMNRRTKAIGKELGIDIKVTGLAARHSFSTVLKNSGVSTSFISESLGHKSERTTRSYLDSFESKTKEANQRLLLNFESDE